MKDNIIFKDKLDNTLTTNFLEYKEYEKILITSGPTKITTSENYVLDGYDLSLDKNKNLIVSKKEAIITDKENNKISLSNFQYNTKSNFFKSLGDIEIQDKNNNTYKFSQIYIDTKKEIIGTDIKAYLNDDRFKINKEMIQEFFQITCL